MSASRAHLAQLAADAWYDHAELVKSEQTAQAVSSSSPFSAMTSENPRLGGNDHRVAAWRPLDADRPSTTAVAFGEWRPYHRPLDHPRSWFWAGVVMAEVTDPDSTLRHVVSERSDKPAADGERSIGPLGTVRCDSQRLGQLLNLVANALMHGARTSPSMSVPGGPLAGTARHWSSRSTIRGIPSPRASGAPVQPCT